MFITRKEHPILAARIVHYLHECRMPELFNHEKGVNRLAHWASVVLPAVFGIRLINLEVMKKLMSEK
jgi:hypothetical protein